MLDLIDAFLLAVPFLLHLRLRLRLRLGLDFSSSPFYFPSLITSIIIWCLIPPFIWSFRLDLDFPLPLPLPHPLPLPLRPLFSDSYSSLYLSPPSRPPTISSSTIPPSPPERFHFSLSPAPCPYPSHPDLQRASIVFFDFDTFASCWISLVRAMLCPRAGIHHLHRQLPRPLW